MKKVKLILSAVVVFGLLAFTTTQTMWNSDKAHTSIGFSIGYLGVTEVVGAFDDFTATITGKKEDFSDAKIEASINVASINTKVEMRDNHLRSADFFEAEKYPLMTFKSTKVELAEDGKYLVTGDLTAKGITKSVVLDMVHGGTIDHPQTKKPAAGFHATGTINRSDFGIGEGFGAPMLKDEVAITINGIFHQASTDSE